MAQKAPARPRHPRHPFLHASRIAPSLKRGSALSLLLALCSLVNLCATVSASQGLSNELVLADGPVIVDPNLNAVLRTGGIADIIISTSRGGMDPSAALIATSGLPPPMTLVSLQSGMRIYISPNSGLRFVSQDSDDDGIVTRYAWPVPSCLTPGEYIITVDSTHATRAMQLVVVPISISITVDDGNQYTPSLPDSVMSQQSADNGDTFPLQGFARRDQSVQLPNSTSTYPASSAEATGITVTAGSIGITVVPTTLPATIVIEPPTGTSSSGLSTMYNSYTTSASVGGSGVAVTVTETETTATPESVTVVTTSLETIVSTTTAPGTTIEFTTTKTMVSTTMVVTTQSSSSGGDFLPITSSATRIPVLPVYFLLTAWLCTVTVASTFLRSFLVDI